jgi:hypothetical protein
VKRAKPAVKTLELWKRRRRRRKKRKKTANQSSIEKNVITPGKKELPQVFYSDLIL